MTDDFDLGPLDDIAEALLSELQELVEDAGELKEALSKMGGVSHEALHELLKREPDDPIWTSW